jgi:hypothetical protein
MKESKAAKLERNPPFPLCTSFLAALMGGQEGGYSVCNRREGFLVNRETLIKKTLVLAIEEGLDEKGKPIVKRYSYANIKNSATAENLSAAAHALADLYNGTPYEFTTVNTNVLI